MSLLETVAALALEATVLIALTVTLTSMTTMASSLRDLRDAAMEDRRIEHLIDHAAGRAGSGPTSPIAVALAETSRVVFQADLNGDGLIDARTSERTEFVLRAEAGGQRLSHRIGRQSITLVRNLSSDRSIEFTDADGHATRLPSAIRSVQIPTGTSQLVVALRTTTP